MKICSGLRTLGFRLGTIPNQHPNCTVEDEIHATLLVYQVWGPDDNEDDKEGVSTALERGHHCAQLFHVSPVHDVGHVIDNLRVLSK